MSITTVTEPAAAPQSDSVRRADAVSRRAEALADRWAGLPEGVTRWRLAAAIRGAAGRLELSAGMLRLLEHYIDLTYDQDWSPDSEPIICRPLVETAEALNLSERQVRNLERSLVERGLLAFRDSGNHHRRGRRDRHSGRLLYAYGPTLAPLGARGAEILALATAARTQIAETRRIRLAISALRKRLRAELASAAERGVDTSEITAAFAAEPARTHARLGHAELAHRRDALAALQERLAARTAPTGVDAAANATASSEAEISGRRSPGTSNHHAMNGVARADEPRIAGTARDSAGTPLARKGDRTGEEHGLSRIPLRLALSAAGPLIRPAATVNGGWRDLVDNARRAATAFGVPDSAWAQACQRLGRGGAAAAMIVIERGLERPNHERGPQPIRSATAYLLGMIARSDEGRLRLDRSIRALAAAEPQRADGIGDWR